MLRTVFFGFMLFALCLEQAQCEQLECPMRVSREKETIIKDVLKWKIPEDNLGMTGKPVSSGQNVDFQCNSGFLKNEFISEKYTLQCGNGKFNRTLLYDDLLCRNDQFKNIEVEKISSGAFRSKIFKCSEPNFALYEVRIRKSDGTRKLLYVSCINEKQMRAKFGFQPRRNDKPQLHHRPPDAVWGFDGIGSNTDERLQMSKGYVKKAQAKRIARFFDRYGPGQDYPYYFNRGHLVAMADYNDNEEMLGTCEYLNAAPQWDVFNSGSWSIVEKDARAMLQTDTNNWEVYTGTYGIIPSQRGPVHAAALFDEKGKFKSLLLPVPMLYWKIVHNLKDGSKSRAFVGVNNPELKDPSLFPQSYKICTPIRPDSTGALYKGSEFTGFIYECKMDDLLAALKRQEKIVK